jgi:hypothetical protein
VASDLDARGIFVELSGGKSGVGTSRVATRVWLEVSARNLKKGWRSSWIRVIPGLAAGIGDAPWKACRAAESIEDPDEAVVYRRSCRRRVPRLQALARAEWNGCSIVLRSALFVLLPLALAAVIENTHLDPR